MNNKFYNILKGRFLVSEDSFKNWKFIIFLSFLAIAMIYSSHSAERKVHEIAKLNNKVKELRSEFVDVRSSLMLLKMETRVTRIMKKRGLNPSEIPPQIIRIKNNK
ncbi:MAG: S-adenosyl-methyltransferase [Flavobacteriaceae bacterium]|nr:S-adenosyl-methyltransferase [Flavobacteriaceae bacterium]